MWRNFLLQDDDTQVHLCVVPGIDLCSLLQSLGMETLPDALEQAIPVLSPPGSRPVLADLASAVLEVPSITELSLAGLAAHPPVTQEAPFAVVLGRDTAYAFAHGGPCHVAVLHHILAFEAPAHAVPHRPCWTTLDGRAVPTWQDISGVTALHFIPEHDSWQPPCFSTATVCAVEVLANHQPFRIRMQPAGHLQDQLSFPTLTFQSLGWNVIASPDPAPVDFLFCPRQLGFRLPADNILSVCAEQLTAGVLNCLQTRDTATVPSQVQISGRTFWQGRLPGHLTYQDVLDLWELCHLRVGHLSKCRAYSGPRRMEPSCTLLQARFDKSSSGFITRRGFLKVTLAPQLSGGGAKDRKYMEAQTSLAQFLLDRGMALSEASAVTDKIMPAAGVGRITQLLRMAHGDSKWDHFEALCKQFHIPCPPVDSRMDKVQRRVMAEAKRRSATQRPISARDYTLQPGYFYHGDGTPANILPCPYPDSSGVVLCDLQEARSHLDARQHSSCDELALVVLGLTCPDEQHCSGPLTIPAFNSSSEPVLLRGCMHQLGEGAITCKCAKDVQVSLDDLVCCAFTAIREDWREEEWTGLLASPAKRMLEVFASTGVDQAFEAPWGRSFRSGSHPAAPGSCTSIQMHGKVARTRLDQVLRRSGHNRIYATPKTWMHEVSDEYRVIWVSAEREGAVQAALNLPAQLGVVMAKGRFGVRVAKATFESAHKAIKPTEPLPPQVDVKFTFKVSSVPPGTRAVDLVTWGQQLGWPLKALRSAGPHQWLIGAASMPPPGLHSINNQPILITAHGQRQTLTPIVSAGRPSRAPHSGGEVAAADPWQKTDPWAQYLQGKPSASPAVAVREVPAPAAKRFEEQEARMAVLEKDIDMLKTGQHALKTSMEATATSVQSKVTAFHQDLESFKTAFAQQLQDNCASLQAAQQAQQLQMTQGFSELKQLLQTPVARAAKRPASAAPMELADDS